MPNRESDTNDGMLIRGLQNGNADAFRALYNKYAPRLQGFAARFRISPEEADEITQETFIRIWLHRQQVREDAAFCTYMITIAKRLILNHLRQFARREMYIKEVTAGTSTAANISAGNEAELEKIIRKAIQDLPLKCREVFTMSRMEGFSNQQIAEELSISKSTVENQINKALKTIRRTLEKHGYTYHMLYLFLLLTDS
ncbi:MAG: RNA polymerase sigma factor [Flavisolibacter sp.]